MFQSLRRPIRGFYGTETYIKSRSRATQAPRLPWMACSRAGSLPCDCVLHDRGGFGSHRPVNPPRSWNPRTSGGQNGYIAAWVPQRPARKARSRTPCPARTRFRPAPTTCMNSVASSRSSCCAGRPRPTVSPATARGTASRPRPGSTRSQAGRLPPRLLRDRHRRHPDPVDRRSGSDAVRARPERQLLRVSPRHHRRHRLGRAEPPVPARPRRVSGQVRVRARLGDRGRLPARRGPGADTGTGRHRVRVVRDTPHGGQPLASPWPAPG